MDSRHSKLYPRLVKPAIDRAIAAAALIFCGPILVGIAIAVRIKLGERALFRQARPGKDGRPFNLYKFRTMTEARDGTGRLLDDGQRLTPFGKWLRSTSLDELPELWNVVRGEMSLVGPRPLLTQYLKLYTPEQSRRHCVKPGITGLAQVSGRNAISWDEKFRLDLQYVDEFSLWLDIKILAATIIRVVRRDGISAGSHSTMPFFTGTNSTDAPLVSDAA